MKNNRLRILITDYPHLSAEQMEELEKEIAPFIYSLDMSDLRHLLVAGFPFAQNDRLWLENYEHLSRLLQSDHGNLGGLPSLSNWIYTQRRLKRLGTLAPDREKALNQIHFTWKCVKDVWQKHYQEFLQLVKDKRTPHQELRNWMVKMRKTWHQLSPEQRQLLTEAGFELKPFQKHDSIRLNELELVYRNRGHFRGLSSRLVHFVRRLRAMYQKQVLDPETISRCNKMDFDWSIEIPDSEARWDIKYARVRDYIQNYGDKVPPPYHWKQIDISRWVAAQTGKWEKLSSRRQQLLMKIGIFPEKIVFGKIWESHFELARSLYLQFGPYRKRSYPKEYSYLVAWIRRQRLNWNRLDDRQKELLLEIKLGNSKHGENKNQNL